MTKRSLLLCLCLCASHSAHASDPTTVTLSAAQLAPEVAQVKSGPGQPFAFYAAPVQLGTFVAPAPDKSSTTRFTSVRVPQVGTPGLSPTVDPQVKPMFVESQFTTMFDRRTVPLVPYAGFWIAIGNTTDAPLTITPQMFAVYAGAKRHPALADGGAIEGRFQLDVQALESKTLGKPKVGQPIAQLQRQIGFLQQPTPIAPKKAWAGYVSFDVGAFTAEEYHAFLSKAGTLKLTFTPPGNAHAIEATFTVEKAPITVVCLPATPKPSFERCEVIPAAPTQAPATPAR